MRIRTVLPLFEEKSRTQEVRLSFTGPAGLPGTPGRLHWSSGRQYLPADLPVRRDGRLGIFLLEEGSASYHVLPDAIEGQPALVRLDGNTRVITEGRHRLSDGDPVDEISTGEAP